MQYIHVVEKQNYEIFSSGRVLYALPGSAPFPVRLIDEIFHRCCTLIGKHTNLRLYDPCVGAGYMLTVLGLLHQESIESLTGSDIDEKALTVAKKNLSLLTPDGLELRIQEIENLYAQYGKDSHKDALSDAKTLLTQLAKNAGTIKTTVFEASVNDIADRSFAEPFDIILFDTPYGTLTDRSETVDLETICVSLLTKLTTNGVLVIVTDKKSAKIKNSKILTKKGSFNHGKRRITFVQK